MKIDIEKAKEFLTARGYELTRDSRIDDGAYSAYSAKGDGHLLYITKNGILCYPDRIPKRESIGELEATGHRYLELAGFCRELEKACGLL